MVRWSRIATTGVLVGALALILPFAVLAQAADKPSFFESLWSKVKGAVERDDSDSDDPAIVSPSAEIEAGEAEIGETAPAGATPSLSGARWIGFTPVLVAGRAAGEGAWIAGPFIDAGDTVWVTDTLSGLTIEARLIWREAAEGSLAELSAEAGKGLGLSPGAVANVTIYLAR